MLSLLSMHQQRQPLPQQQLHRLLPLQRILQSVQSLVRLRCCLQAPRQLLRIALLAAYQWPLRPLSHRICGHLQQPTPAVHGHQCQRALASRLLTSGPRLQMPLAVPLLSPGQVQAVLPGQPQQHPAPRLIGLSSKQRLARKLQVGPPSAHVVPYCCR